MRTLKDHFIPHEGNGHRPHFLRAETMRIVAGFAILFELAAFLLPTFSYVSLIGNNFADVLPTVLGALTNDQREALNLPTLRNNPLLDRAAQLKAEDMAAKGYFAHKSPEGKEPWYWLKQVGYQYDYAGENLAVNFTDSAAVTEAWMNSPTHRANIAKAAYTEIGTGVATGMYEGRETVFVAQVFGRPATPAPASDPVPTPVREPVVTTTTSTPRAQQPRAPANTSLPQAPVRTTSSGAVAGTASTTPTTTLAIASTTTSTPTSSLGTEPSVPSTVAAAAQASSLIEQMATSPQRTTSMVFTVLLLAVAAAVAINLLANRFRMQHFDLLTNGMVVVAVIGAFLVFNGYLATQAMQSTTVTYAATDTSE